MKSKGSNYYFAEHMLINIMLIIYWLQFDSISDSIQSEQHYRLVNWLWKGPHFTRLRTKTKLADKSPYDKEHD